MSATERRYTFSFTLLFILCALACFVAGFCVVQDWLTVGPVWAWGFGGFIFSTLAKLPL